MYTLHRSVREASNRCITHTVENGMATRLRRG